MKNTFFSLSVVVFIFMCISTGICQTVTNGSFDGTSTGWTNCGLTGPEVRYTEQAYGSTATCGGGGSCNQEYSNCGTGCAGNPSPNYVAEVDNGDSKALCQDVTLTSGSHTMYVELSRRTNTLPSGKGAPPTTSIQVCLIDPGNAANQICRTFSRINTTFAFTSSSWAFNTSSLPFGLPAGGTLTLQITNISDYSCGSCSNNYGMIIGYVGFNAPTPVTLLNFRALRSGSGVDIGWQTASEKNNDYFIVEKSKDGVEFIGVDSLKGAGTSQSWLSYRTTDPEPYNGVSYYRLKQVDYDGTVSYSNTEAVNFNGNKNITVYPNPGTGIFNIQGLNAETEISVQNPLGQVVLIKKVFSGSSEVDLSSQPSGVYFIKVNDGNTTASNKIILYR